MPQALGRQRPLAFGFDISRWLATSARVKDETDEVQQ